MKRILMYFVVGLLVFTSSIGWSAETVLRTGYQQDSPPRYFVDGGKDKGVCIDVINALNEKLSKQNIRIMSTGTYSLARINSMMEKNELDLFVGLMKSPEREQKFVFSSVPVFGVRGQFAKLAADLSGVRVQGTGQKTGSRVPGTGTENNKEYTNCWIFLFLLLSSSLYPEPCL